MAVVAAVGAVVGAATSVYGVIKGNQAQSAAEEANAKFYAEQAEYAQKAGERELAIYRDQAEEFFGAQSSAAARGGVEISGSPLLALADTRSRQLREEAAIKMDTATKVREAMLKGGASQENANRLSSFEANFLPAIGGAATGLATAYGIYKGGSSK